MSADVTATIVNMVSGQSGRVSKYFSFSGFLLKQ